MAYVPLFTPLHAGIGGLLLGASASAKIVLNGRILGISGSIKGLLAGDQSGWRKGFLAGMLGGAVAALWLIPGSFMPLPETYTPLRAAIGGFLVGLGAAIGNGCTSGHGICGNARLSPRSMAYTLTFMATGFLVATLTGTAAALNVPQQPVTLSLPSLPELQLGMGLLAAFAAIQGSIALAGRAASQEGVGRTQKWLDWLSEGVAGCFTSLGLALAGMTLPAKVASFLSVTHPAWDPSLAFVMGSALLVALPSFLHTLVNQPLARPILTNTFSLPSRRDIDPQLLAGGVLFGAGWGLTGICPGPALVNLVQPSPAGLAFVGSMCAGMVVERMVEGGRAKGGKAALA